MFTAFQLALALDFSILKSTSSLQKKVVLFMRMTSLRPLGTHCSHLWSHQTVEDPGIRTVRCLLRTTACKSWSVAARIWEAEVCCLPPGYIYYNLTSNSTFCSHPYWNPDCPKPAENEFLRCIGEQKLCSEDFNFCKSFSHGLKCFPWTKEDNTGQDSIFLCLGVFSSLNLLSEMFPCF